MPQQLDNWHGGVLYEISPFGTGFIEDTQTGSIYGFHKSMLRSTSNLSHLEGSTVKFHLNAIGTVEWVHVLAA